MLRSTIDREENNESGKDFNMRCSEPKFTKALGIIGLVVSFAGVWLLFRYGMPFRIPSPGGSFIVTGQANPSDLEIDARYNVLGYFGFILITSGTACQIAGIGLTDSRRS
jgi:hypothetical protein